MTQRVVIRNGALRIRASLFEQFTAWCSKGAPPDEQELGGSKASAGSIISYQDGQD